MRCWRHMSTMTAPQYPEASLIHSWRPATQDLFDKLCDLCHVNGLIFPWVFRLWLLIEGYELLLVWPLPRGLFALPGANVPDNIAPGITGVLKPFHRVKVTILQNGNTLLVCLYSYWSTAYPDRFSSVPFINCSNTGLKTLAKRGDAFPYIFNHSMAR